MKTKTPLTDAIYSREPAVICTGTVLEELVKLSRRLECENAALREKFMFAESEIILLREDREQLRADKERLDYMERNVDFVSWRFYGKPEPWNLRGTVDAKRKEAQP